MKALPRILTATALAACALPAFAKTPDGKPLVVFIAGKPSHGPGEHEHNAGVQLLAKCMAQGMPNVATKVHLNAEWPATDTLAQADTIVVYSDGQGGHAALADDRLDALRKEMNRGCGFVCLHYAVEPVFSPTGWSGPQKGPDGKPMKIEIPAGRGSRGKGAAEFLEWLGGYFEQYWSVNPHWTADFKELPKHPISSGVKPFSTNDEWYFHMRFRAGLKGVTPILSAIAPPETMNRGEGPHAGNPDVKREVLEEKKPQHVAWAAERPNGGRGFGFTGGHFHRGWGNDDQRKLVLNAIVWTAKADVPANGVESKVTEEELNANLDPKAPRKAPAPKPAASATPARPIFNSEVVREKPVAIKADLKGAKELFLVVTDGGDGFTADWADWMEPTLIKADGSKIKLTELTPKISKVGFANLGVNKNARGQALRVGGGPVEFGFFAHAPSIIGFDLPPGVVAFEGRGGIDNGGTDQKIGSTVTFQLYTQNPGDAATAPSRNATPGDKPYGLAAAQELTRQMILADGLEVSAFAAEPMIQNPTNLEVDPHGRVWAVEQVNYRRWSTLKPAGDRVVILADTNGDGTADKETTFFQSSKLTNPLGLCLLPGKDGGKAGTRVIVSAAPNVWLLTDTDGDDKADKETLLLTGIRGEQHDHSIHACVVGPDGRLYFNMGNAGVELRDPEGNIVTDLNGNQITDKGKPYRQGMVFRAELRGERLANIETLGWNFRNNYEAAVDSFGTIWQSDNDDDGNKGVRINYVMEFGSYGYSDEVTGAGWQAPRTNIETEIPLRHWHQNDPGTIPNLLQTGQGSPTGILVNEGSALGAAFTNQLIHCDAGPRTVRAYPVEKSGAGYTATMVDILTAPTDSWYRPSDVAIAPDGSLFVADWYDPGVGGHAMGDNDASKIRGRIYRVAAKGAKLSTPKIDLTTASGAVAALKSPNNPTRAAAWQSLHALGARAEADLVALSKDTDPRLRARAFALLAQTPGVASQHLRRALEDADADVRVAAVRLCYTLSKSKALDTTPLEEDRALVAKLIRDPSPAVRRQIAMSLAWASDIAQLWVALAQQHDGKDRWYLEALGIGSRGNEDACLDAWLAAVGDKWDTPAGRDIIWRVRASKAPTLLAKIIAGTSIPENEKPRFIRALDFLPSSPAKNEALLQLAALETKNEPVALEALSRLARTDIANTPAVKTHIENVLAGAKGTPRLIELVRDFGLKGRGAELLEIAARDASNPLAIDAVRLALAEPDSVRMVSTALAQPNGARLADLLANTDRGPGILVALIRDAAQDTALRRNAVQALARNAKGVEQLLTLARNNSFPAELKDTAASALHQVQFAQHKDEIARLFPAPNALGGQPLPPIAELVKLKGDAVRGKTIAENAATTCVTCHRIGNSGVDFGPGLSEIGSKLGKDALYDAIINPNAGVSMGFETWQITLKNGGGGMGIIRSETADELVLALPMGVTTKFAKRDIARREKLPNSMMPSGLNQALSKTDLVDLVEYLASLKKK